MRKTLAKPQKGRAARRKTISFFGQLSDPQIADEMSPARGELIDRVGSPFESSWRPQEAWNLQNFDQLVRNMNDNRTSPFRGRRGKRARMKFVLNTGDMADSAQLNEARWYIQVLEGGQIDPFSGVPVTPENCPQADEPAEVAALNAAVAARAVHGRPGLRRLARRAGRPLRRLLGPGRGAAVGREPVCGMAALPRTARPRAADVHGRGPRRAVVHGARQPRHDLAGHVHRADRAEAARDLVPQGVPERQVRSRALQGQPGADRAGPRRRRLHQPAARRGAARSARPRPPLPSPG